MHPGFKKLPSQKYPQCLVRLVVPLLLGAGGQQSDEARGGADGQDVVYCGVEVLEQEEGCDDDQHQEQSVVVEDGEGSGFVVGHFILLPQDPLVFLLAGHLAVVCLREFPGHLFGHGVLSLLCNFVFQHKLDVLVGEGHQVSADQSHDSVQDGRLHQVHVPDPPEQPDGDRGDNQRVAVEQSRGFGGEVSAEVLEQQVFL